MNSRKRTRSQALRCHNIVPDLLEGGLLWRSWFENSDLLAWFFPDVHTSEAL